MDSQTILTFIFVGLSFGLYVSLAIWARAGSTSEFYVAGGGVSPVANGMAIGADWMSAASYLSMTGLIAFSGYFGSVYLLGWTGGYVLLALLLAPYLRKYGKFTVPDFIGDRYYSQVARVVAVVCLLFISYTYIAGQMRGVGVVFSRFLEVDVNTGVIIGAFIVFFYATLGGMKGITYTQVAQYCVMIVAYLTPAFFISMLITGNPIPQLGFGSEYQDSGLSVVQKMDQVLVDLGFNAYTAVPQNILNTTCIALALMFGTAGLPHVIVRFFTVPRVRDARISAGWALVFIALLYTTAGPVASFARLNFIDSVDGVARSEAPAWFDTWETTGLLAHNDKNGDGIMQYRPGAHDDPASANEVKLDRDIMVLANPEIAGLPEWVIALVAAGGLAAALSTAAGLLLVISSAVSHDILKKWAMPNISEKGELLAARISMVVAVGVATMFGIFPPGFVAQTVALAFGLAASSLFPAILMGIFFSRINRAGAIAGMAAGLGFTFGYILNFALLDNPLGVDLLFGISATGIGVIGMVLNFAVAFAVSFLTKAPPKSVQDIVDLVRSPKGAGAAVAH